MPRATRGGSTVPMQCDYLIIGAGSAGSVLAARLSEDPSNKVLLVEAGRDVLPGRVPSDISDVFPLSTFNPAYVWGDLRAHWRRADNSPPVPFQQGRIVGGGSTVMGMWAVRGMPDDYETWARAGATNWGWSDVLPYFRKLESDHDFAGPLHGRDGPIPIRRLPSAQWSPLAQAMHGAANLLGFPAVEDMNADFRDGHCTLPISRYSSTRASAGLCYLNEPVRARRNLSIIAHATAERLVVEASRVVGALVRREGQTQAVRIDARETLVCAGAIHSPAILMRSGIGPGKHLVDLGIPVVADRPGVGANLQNHPLLPAVAWLHRGGRDARRGRPPASTYLRWSSGVLDAGPGDMGLYIRSYLVWHALGRHMAMVGPVLMRPFSRGTVRLANADSRVPPVVAFNFLDDSRDRERLTDGLRTAAALLDTPCVREVCSPAFMLVNAGRLARFNHLSVLNGVLGQAASVLLDILPRVGEAAMDLLTQRVPLSALVRDEDALAAVVIEQCGGTNHVAGTCRMGRSDDPDSVVDTAGRVFGIAGLRVVDASIMPTVPSGNTHLPTVMVAEKVADAMKTGRHATSTEGVA